MFNRKVLAVAPQSGAGTRPRASRDRRGVALWVAALMVAVPLSVSGCGGSAPKGRSASVDATTAGGGNQLPVGATPTATVPGPAVGAGTGPSVGPPASAQPRATVSIQPLVGARLPDNNAADWRPIGTPVTRTGVPRVRVNECAAVRGAEVWQQQGYRSTFDTPAIQDTFVFATAVDAHAAEAVLLSAMAGCQKLSRTLQSQSGVADDAVVTTTATMPASAAFVRRWTGVLGLSAGGRQSNHYYIVQRENVLAVLQFTEGIGHAGAPGYDVAGDRGVLATLIGYLAGQAPTN